MAHIVVAQLHVDSVEMALTVVAVSLFAVLIPRGGKQDERVIPLNQRPVTTLIRPQTKQRLTRVQPRPIQFPWITHPMTLRPILSHAHHEQVTEITRLDVAKLAQVARDRVDE